LALDLVRIDENEQAVVLFTDSYRKIKLHYCDDPEIRGFVVCNTLVGDRCLLCDIGRKVDERALMPVYHIASRTVAVLAIPPSARPGALRPAVMSALKTGKSLLLIRKPDRATFKVRPKDLPDNVDDGVHVITAFKRRWEAGEVDLLSVYSRIDNTDLAEIPSIAEMLKIMEIQP
jgi:hypothetical protein